MVLLPAWLRHCGTMPAGIEQVLTKRWGRRKELVEGMAEQREGNWLPLYPSKAADSCQDTVNHFAFSARTQDKGQGMHRDNINCRSSNMCKR